MLHPDSWFRDGLILLINLKSKVSDSKATNYLGHSHGFSLDVIHRTMLGSIARANNMEKAGASVAIYICTRHTIRSQQKMLAMMNISVDFHSRAC